MGTAVLVLLLWPRAPFVTSPQHAGNCGLCITGMQIFVLCPSITPLLEGQLPIGHGNRFPCLGYHPLSFPKRCHLHMALGLPEPVLNIDLDFH